MSKGTVPLVNEKHLLRVTKARALEGPIYSMKNSMYSNYCIAGCVLV